MSHKTESVVGNFTYFDNADSEIYERSSAQVSRSELIVFTQYETINRQQHRMKYYWVKEQVREALKNILQVDTIEIIDSVSIDPTWGRTHLHLANRIDSE